ncbi:IS607 family element RNA-guided endonuclease TnpB [Micromonospora sp. NBC_00617]|uniref:IS607 family element RNA-guided endonuclease TnpB n=1 Tax=Micromonospora sp. NBC_00617 TaxID=2903587 RepID=UPI0030E523C9
MKTVQAYRFALDLAPRQERAVLAHAGAARVAHNWALARVRAVLDQRAAERSYGMPEEHLTPAVGWTLPALRRAWNGVEDEVAPWWAQCSKEAFNTGLDDLARALKNWTDSRAGNRAGRPVGFPRFKSRRRSVPSVRFTTGAIRVEPDRKHVVLPRLGRLKLHESARKLARRLDNDTARIMSATVRRDGGRWHVAFTCEVERSARVASRPVSTVGVDVGIKRLAVLSTGELVPNPRHLGGALRRIRGIGRAVSRKAGPDRRAGVRPSKRWQRASVRLARHIADAGFAEIRRQLTYKTSWNGGRLITADRWYPSSKTCSGCGTVKTKLALSERQYQCEACGLALDRDLNAARNLAALAAQATTAGSGPVAARGADQKTCLRGQVAVKREPGTATAGKTGTVPPQGGTTNHALTKAH